MAKEFRFGVILQALDDARSAPDWARRVEGLGFDVAHVADHLHMGAPFPMMTAFAVATERLHVGTYVLNAGFYRPALLARDAASLRDLSGGRVELGLGAGYVKEEFEQAELAYPSAGQRVTWLGHVTEHVVEHLPDVPVLIAGNGDRVLTLAAQRAHVVGLTGNAPATPESDPLADRIAFVREAAGDRANDLVFNIMVTGLAVDRLGPPDLTLAKRFLSHLSDEELLRTPGILAGSATEVADTLRHYRDHYGITYVSVAQDHAEEFAKVIAELR